MLTLLLSLLLQSDRLAEFRGALDDLRQAHQKGDDDAEKAAGARVMRHLGEALQALESSPKEQRAAHEKTLKEMASALGVGDLTGNSPKYLTFLKRLVELGALDAKGRKEADDASKRKIAELLATLDAPKGFASVIPPVMKPDENGASAILAAITARETSLKGAAKEVTDFLNLVRTREDAARLSVHAKAAIDAAKPAIDELQRVGGRRSRFEVDWDQGPAAMTPHITGLLQCQRLVAAVAMAHHQLDQHAEARAVARLGLELVASPVDEPTILAALVRTVCLRIAITTLGELFAAGSPTADDLSFARAALLRIDPRAIYDRGWQGEGCNMAVAFEQLLASMGGHATALPIATLLREDVAVGLGLLARLRSTTKLPVKDARDIVKSIEDETKSLPMLSALLVPAFTKSWQSMVQLEAQVAVAKAGLAAIEFHAKHGKWPESVADLDPFTGRPLLFRDGVVYSVGADGKDDGGDEEKDVRFRAR
jgi:hypothetical protein